MDFCADFSASLVVDRNYSSNLLGKIRLEDSLGRRRPIAGMDGEFSIDDQKVTEQI